MSQFPGPQPQQQPFGKIPPYNPQQPPFQQSYNQQHWQQPPQGYSQPPYQQPPPHQKKRKVPFILAGIVASLVVFACIGSMVAASHGATTTTTQPVTVAQPTHKPQPTDTPTPKPSLASQLATIDTGSTPDAATITKYQTVLDSLQRKTEENEQTISDETVNGQKLVHDKYSKDVSLLELLQQTDQSLPGTQTHYIHYADALAAYITLAYGQ